MLRVLAAILIIGAALHLAVAPSEARPLELVIASGPDDGVERDDLAWDADASPLIIGRPGDGAVHDLGLRFVASGLAAIDEVIHARLRFSARGGAITDSLVIMITGVLEPESTELSALRRPSQLPRTEASHVVTLRRPWLDGGTKQLFYYTGDLAPIINEVIAQSDWGGSPPALILCVDDITDGGAATGHVACSALATGRWPVTLQVARTIAETLTAHEIVGRPTDRSATVNFAAMIDLEAYVEFGVSGPDQQTTPVLVPADTPVDIELTALAPDTEHGYRFCYRAAGDPGEYKRGEWRTFRTQRPPGASFRFTVQADSHIWDSWSNANPDHGALKLYERTIDNIAADAPEFHVGMGDYSLTAYSLTPRQALDRYLVQRRFLDRLLHSVPMYLVLGNHEGELGYLHAAGDSVVVWAEAGRRACVPNPYPDGFYSGCPDPPLSGDGWRESYYAWEWGDALFVVLDPYLHTTERPFHNPMPSQGRGWNWTLGREQYDWLFEAVNGSERRWKFVLIHQLIGGIGQVNDFYGRGGIEAAKFAVDGRPSFEWGGEDEWGCDDYAAQRPGWLHGSIHDLLVDADVTAVFFGHDHLYAYQELDGLVYLTVPQPHDFQYGYGGLEPGGYVHGTLLPNSGHVRVDVEPERVVIEYVRSYLPGDGPNREVADRHVIMGGPVAAPAASPVLGLSATPNPSSGQTVVQLVGLDKADAVAVELLLYDVAGRLVRTVPADAGGQFVWDQRDRQGRPVASGTYHGRLAHAGREYRVRVAVVR